MNKNQPVHEIRLGLVKASIWENQSGENIHHNVTFSRIYKDQEEWKFTESFGRDDLLLLGKVADHAHTWIHQQRASKAATAETQDRPSARPLPRGSGSTAAAGAGPGPAPGGHATPAVDQRKPFREGQVRRDHGRDRAQG